MGKKKEASQGPDFHQSTGFGKYLKDYLAACVHVQSRNWNWSWSWPGWADPTRKEKSTNSITIILILISKRFGFCVLKKFDHEIMWEISKTRLLFDSQQYIDSVPI